MARLLEAASLPLVLVHDVARPFVSRGLVARVLGPPKEAAPPSPSSPCPTPSWPRRGGLRPGGAPGGLPPGADPPGVFHRPPPGGPRLRPEEGSRASDDAQLVQALGYPVALVEGEATAFKITHPQDLVLAEALARVWSA